MGEYKEITASNQSINQIITPKDSNKIYVVDAAHILRMYNYQGELLLEKELKLDGYEFMRLCNDGLSCIFLKTVESKDQNGWTVVDKYILCYDFTYDSEIFEVKFISFVIPIYALGMGVYNINFDFNSKTHKGFLIYNFSKGYGGGVKTSYFEGNAFTFDLINNQFKSIAGSGYKYFDISEDYEKILLNNYSKEYHWDMNYDYTIETKIFRFSNNLGLNFKTISYNHSETNYHDNDVYGFIPDFFKIANNDPRYW